MTPIIQINNSNEDYQALEGLCLGQKIGKVKKLLDKDLVDRLGKLNKKRIILIHGASGELIANARVNPVGTGKFETTHKKGKIDLDIPTLTSITKEAREIVQDLYNRLPIPKQNKHNIS